MNNGSKKCEKQPHERNVIRCTVRHGITAYSYVNYKFLHMRLRHNITHIWTALLSTIQSYISQYNFLIELLQESQLHRYVGVILGDTMVIEPIMFALSWPSSVYSSKHKFVPSRGDFSTFAMPNWGNMPLQRLAMMLPPLRHIVLCYSTKQYTFVQVYSQ